MTIFVVKLNSLLKKHSYEIRGLPENNYYGKNGQNGEENAQKEIIYFYVHPLSVIIQQ